MLLELAHGGRTTLLGLGDPTGVRSLLGEPVSRPVNWMTIPRIGAGPVGVRGEPTHEGDRHSAEADLDPAVQEALAVRPASAWDWMATTRRPTSVDAGVVRLDLESDHDAIVACLAEANPNTSTDPAHPDEAAWFGVRTDEHLLGVIGAGLRRGAPDAADRSWHVHGLGVLPSARGRGLGGALTAAATAAGLEDGLDWVSLGMYASNTPARRVYERLGFAVEGRFTSYRSVTSASGASPRR